MSNPGFVVFEIPFKSKYKMRMTLIDDIVTEWDGYVLSPKWVTVMDMHAVEYTTDEDILDDLQDTDVVYRTGEFCVTCTVSGDLQWSADEMKQDISKCAELLNKLFWWKPPIGDAIESEEVEVAEKGNVCVMTLDLAKVKVRSFSCTSEKTVAVPEIVSW